VAKGKVAPTLREYARLNWTPGPTLFAGDTQHHRDLLREFRALLSVARAADRVAATARDSGQWSLADAAIDRALDRLRAASARAGRGSK